MSLRAELVRLGTRWLLKRRGHHESVHETRRRLNNMEGLTPKPPRGTRIEAISAGGIEADRVAASGSHRDRHVLFLHGGAYRAGPRTNYRHFTWRIAAATRAQALALDYRLPPE